MTVDVVNSNNEKVGTVELPKEVFGVAWKPELVHQILVAQRANQRKPIAHAKDRSEVVGSGRKPWKQKHTGRARAGAVTSPIWRGGGITFGPTKEKSFKKTITKKMKRAALASILSKKAESGEVIIVDSFSLPEIKTKHMARTISVITGERKKVVCVPGKGRSDIVRSGRNISGAKIMYPALLNVQDCLSHKYILIEKEAVSDILKGAE